MADDLATDPDYIEACRVAAWTERPAAESNRYWDAGARKFNFPAGWPEGVAARACRAPPARRRRAAPGERAPAPALWAC